MVDGYIWKIGIIFVLDHDQSMPLIMLPSSERQIHIKPFKKSNIDLQTTYSKKRLNKILSPVSYRLRCLRSRCKIEYCLLKCQWLLVYCYDQPPVTLGLINTGLGLYLDGWPYLYVNFCWYFFGWDFKPRSPGAALAATVWIIFWD